METVLPNRESPPPQCSKVNLLTPGWGEGKISVYCRAPSKQNGQLMLKRPKVPDGFQRWVSFNQWVCWSHQEACGILVLRPGIKLMPLPLECRVLTTGPPGKSSVKGFKRHYFGWGLQLAVFWLVAGELTRWRFENLNHQTSGPNQSGVTVLVVHM